MMEFVRLLCVLVGISFSQAADIQVGPLSAGGHVVTTKQLIRPAGESLEFAGRPVDLALSPNGRNLYLKTNDSLIVIDTRSWSIRQKLALGKGLTGSFHGLAVKPDGSLLYVTTSQKVILEMLVATDGTVSVARHFDIAAPDKGSSTPCGLALSPDEQLAIVCLSRNNTVGVLQLSSGKLVRQIPVGVAPYDVVLTRDGSEAWVSNWGGRRAGEGDRTAMSSGTPALADERGVACSGTVSLVDLKRGKEVAEVETGLHPCDLVLDATKDLLYVANANSDTVTVVDTRARKAVRTIAVRPDDSLPFGSAPNALALGDNGGTLYVANGCNNAVAVIDTQLRGFIPTGWYPGALAIDSGYLYIANVKGYGSRYKKPVDKSLEGRQRKEEDLGWMVYGHLGTVQKVELPSAERLAIYSRQVRDDAGVPQTLRALEKAQAGVKPVPVPKHPGEPSTIEHVVYIIKENKTYDQVFGDMGKGNSEPRLCVFGREITPNHHALADQFVLLDNYYCNGVLSADGHQWATQGYVTDYLEKGFGGFPRSYPYKGDDPLTFASSGFIWDNALLHGLSFRNYGEMSTQDKLPGTVQEIYADYVARKTTPPFNPRFSIDTLKRYSCQRFPGFSLGVPDQVRAAIFLEELADAEKTGQWPELITVALPNNHTRGLSPGAPTPLAYVCDNDLALAQIVEGISKSRFWPKTAIFVIEDDPQSGYDHVDGHRSVCLVISPYAKRGAVVSRFYNQTSVLHTMQLILGLPPMNQMDAMAPVMGECFTDTPDLTPYTALPVRHTLEETNPQPATKVSLKQRYWTDKSLAMNFDQPDRVDDNVLNRVIWYSVKGFDTHYPAEFAGAHGKGLKALNLSLDPSARDDD
ncbi:MAG TPA: bifunctional YncE family protein/alkaline phosphatase family protein [Phycisphaerae bacterium]|nr:bifunctional YncE family protein/alkaline phosphatase family protein [Phycisphaerae bacterium]HRY70443.1 bifunctional YncE family protein/alkaline phosphatase family protein [Phycisphaerae bacterium]HSA27677.1 bifunctional YncE family protein/alkaline phosphatase family protein [Phycisphaerae bacterium]